jgi:hypothetical protein
MVITPTEQCEETEAIHIRRQAETRRQLFSDENIVQAEALSTGHWNCSTES